MFKTACFGDHFLQYSNCGKVFKQKTIMQFLIQDADTGIVTPASVQSDVTQIAAEVIPSNSQTPQITTHVAPVVTPEVTPSVTPSVTPPVTPEVTPRAFTQSVSSEAVTEVSIYLYLYLGLY